MTATDLTAMGILVTTIGAVIVNIIMAFRTNTKVNEVSAKADVITGHVNSAATASTAKIDSLEKQVLALRQLVSEDKEKAALLAQSAAITQASNLMPPSRSPNRVSDVIPAETLENIEQNTKDTVKEIKKIK